MLLQLSLSPARRCRPILGPGAWLSGFELFDCRIEYCKVRARSYSQVPGSMMIGGGFVGVAVANRTVRATVSTQDQPGSCAVPRIGAGPQRSVCPPGGHVHN